MNTRDPLAIPDVQGSEDKRKLAIDQVGIKAIRHPIRVAERSGEVQHTVATFNMYVGLPHQFKGTHMSRFVEILNAHEREISVETFRLMLDEMVERLEAQSGHIEMTFPYFVNKAAPISKVKSLVDYAEKHASSELYGLLKRPDEKFVTERAYDNPKFVEDMVRDIAADLNRDKRIEWYRVESENFESIHNHSAYALIEKDKTPK